MINEITGMLVTAYAKCVDWLGLIFLASDTAGIYLGCIAVFMTYRFLLAPVFGAITISGASDIASRHKENKRYHGKYERNQRGKYSR